MSEKKTYFLTGATGLVGSYLLKILLKNNHKVYCLARDKGKKSAKKRVEGVLNFWDESVLKENNDNLKVLRGDITKDNLGLKDDDTKQMQAEVDEVFHCAANIKFSSYLTAMHKVNVTGTKNVLKFVLGFKELKKIHHISTAYVALFREKFFSENCMPKIIGGEVPYIKTKIQAELMVDRFRAEGIPINIYRLPFILGEYKTSKTCNLEQSFYQFLRVINRNLFNYLPIEDVKIPFCFVDDAANSLLLLSKIEENKNFHLFAEQRIILKDVVEAAEGFLSLKKTHIVSRKDFRKNNITSVKKKIFHINILPLITSPKITSYETNIRLGQYNFLFNKFDKQACKRMLQYLLSINFLKKHRF
jgi:thioester reductase-like protein